MKVYVAAPWTCKDEAKEAADRLEAAGHTITQKWWQHREVPGYLVTEDPAVVEELWTQVVGDMQGVMEADVFVLLNLGLSEGKAVETGMALCSQTCQFFYLVGERSNLFHYATEWLILPSIEDVIDDLSLYS